MKYIIFINNIIMSDLYGIRSEISMGNMHSQSVLNANQLHRDMYKGAMKDYKTDVKGVQSEYNQNITEDKGKDYVGQKVEEGSDALSLGDAVKNVKQMTTKIDASSPEGVEAVGKGSERLTSSIASVSPEASKIVGQVTSAKDLARASLKASVIPSDVPMMFHDIDAVINFKKPNISISERTANPLAEAVARNVPTATTTATDVASGVAKPTSVATSGANDIVDATKIATSGTKDASLLSKGAGALGDLGSGLAVAGGVLDAGEDVKDMFESGGKHIIDGNNGLQKASNISGMLSGGLEATGLALDTTGALAPLGLALNVAGALVGGASAIFGHFGDKEDEQNQARAKASAVSQVKKPVTPTSQAVNTGGATETYSSRQQVSVR